MTRSDDIFQAAQRAHEEPPEDGPDFLADKPMGVCPWCGGNLQVDESSEGIFTIHLSPWPVSCKWDEELTEAENRARYAEEAQRAAEHENRLARQAKKRGGEW